MENVAGGEFGETEHTTLVNDQNYHRFIRSAANVVILFGVSWSDTCERACNIIETLAERNPRTRVGIFEATNSELLMHKLGVKSFPTTIRYKGGTEVQRIEGVSMIVRLF